MTGARRAVARDRALPRGLWASWPEGHAYAALPRDEHDALARRQERIEVTTHEGDVSASGFWRESRPFTIDLRRQVTG
ncbi:MAG TPA: hypothetical protein VFS15_24685 [Kofleriaceae bacterium]|nr:hypothetical protein [Kofleriaceae bacterium]